MSDDLVKRLRDTPNWMREGFQDWKDNMRTYDRAPFEAADRIEELEAKLEKAVRLISEKPILATYEDDVQWQKYVIAELTGGKDE